MNFKSLLVSFSNEGQVMQLTLNRPATLNSWSSNMISELHQLLDGFAASQLSFPSSDLTLSSLAPVRIVILHGAGRAFTAGADLNSLSQSASTYTLSHQEHASGIVLKIRRLPQIFIAAVNGPASGAGFSLALACDLRICTRTARFNAAFVKVGLSGGEMGTSFILPRLVGASHAAEILLTGDFIDGERAAQIGLCSRLYEDAESMMQGARELATKLCTTSVLGLKVTKQSLNIAANMTFEATVAMEDRQQVMCMRDEQCMEVGVKYFQSILNKSKNKQPDTGRGDNIKSRL